MSSSRPDGSPIGEYHATAMRRRALVSEDYRRELIKLSPSRWDELVAASPLGEDDLLACRVRVADGEIIIRHTVLGLIASGADLVEAEAEMADLIEERKGASNTSD